MNVNAFKVVHKGTRRGSNWSIHYHYLRADLNLASHQIDKKRATLALDNLTNLEEELKAYLPIYTINAIIKMAPRTVGLMVFGTHKAANIFANRLMPSSVIIIDVEVIGDFLPQGDILSGCGSELQRLRKIFSDINLMKISPPSGTLFCKELLVLN